MIYIVNLAQNERSQFVRVKSALIPTTHPIMLLAALKLQLAALVTVAGIDTADIRSPGVKTALETLDKATKEVRKKLKEIKLKKSAPALEEVEA